MNHLDSMLLLADLILIKCSNNLFVTKLTSNIKEIKNEVNQEKNNKNTTQK